MIKKLSITLFACATLLTANAQKSDTLKFMNDYRQFAGFVISQNSLTKPLADSLMARQDTLMKQYHKVKPQLTDHQVEEYNMLKGRYTKKILEYRGEGLSDGIEAAGDSIGKTANRVGKAVGGFFKGLIKK